MGELFVGLGRVGLGDCRPHPCELFVGLGRVELPTSPLSGVRSNQLSYSPEQCGVTLPESMSWATRFLATAFLRDCRGTGATAAG